MKEPCILDALTILNGKKILGIAKLLLHLHTHLGRLAEWPNALDSKSGIPFLGIGGLNPSSSANKRDFKLIDFAYQSQWVWAFKALTLSTNSIDFAC